LLNTRACSRQITRIGQHIGKNKELAKIIHKYIAEYIGLFSPMILEDIYKSSDISKRNTKEDLVDGLAYTLAEILYNYIGI